MSEDGINGCGIDDFKNGEKEPETNLNISSNVIRIDLISQIAAFDLSMRQLI